MDFRNLSTNANVSRQFAQQLLQNELFRDAALKATEESDASNNGTNSQSAGQTQAASGLDNLLNQLSSAISQASNADPATAANPQAGSSAVDTLLGHPAVQAALGGLELEQALGIRVALGQVSPEAAEKAVSLLNTLPASTVAKVGAVIKNLAPENIEKGINFFQALFSDRGDNSFSQGNNSDLNLSAVNSANLSGADLNKFLQTAYYIMSSGNDVGKFLEQSTQVLQKSDYDDFRAFLGAADTVMYKKENMDTFYAFGNKVLDESHHDFESNLFQMRMVMNYGGKMQDFIDIADNLKMSGMEGRNNTVDLTRIIVDFKKQGNYVPVLFQALADEAREGGDVRDFMDEYMAVRGMADTSPDFSRFNRIERIDGDPMVIKQGESAALFAQAISSRDGLLPESVLFWSSTETGALSNGSSYLDLSTLPPGTYHVAAKIGNYSGTDTAFKTVIVEPNDGSVPIATPAIVLPEAGKLRITIKNGDAGLRSDLYMKLNGANLEKLAENAQKGGGISLEREYALGDKLDFRIRTHANGSTYDHGTDTEGYNGRSYANITQTSPTTWTIGFEDLSGENADWDFNDVVVEIELLKIANQGNSEGNTGEDGPVIDGGAPVGGVVNTPAAVVPLTKAEATQVTRDAITSLNGGATGTSVSNTLNERYYKALDDQLDSNTNYAQLLSDARSDSGQLKQVLNQVLQELTGEAPQTGKGKDAPPPPVQYNPYF